MPAMWRLDIILTGGFYYKMNIHEHTGRILVIATAIFFAFSAVSAQTNDQNNSAVATNIQKSESAVKPAAIPYLDNYRDVKIGAAADDVIDKLGKPKFKDDSGFLFDLSKNETLQIKLGPDSKVITVAAIFSEETAAPTFTDVFGPTATPDPRADVSIYKMVRYPEAGFWISYYKGAGKDATVAVTIQKL